MAPHSRISSALLAFSSKLKLPKKGAKTETPNSKFKANEDFLNGGKSPKAFISAVDEKVVDLASHKKGGFHFSIPFGISRGNGRSQEEHEVQPETSTSDSSEGISNRVQARPGRLNVIFGSFRSLLTHRPGFLQRQSHDVKPVTGAAEDFIDDLSMDEAIALLESEMAEDLAPDIYSPQETGLARFKPVKQISEKFNDLIKRQTMTITVENEVVRIVVFQDREVVAWGVANPKQDPFRGLEMARNDEEYTSRMKGLLNELKFRRLRVVADLPFYVPLMRNIQVPKIPKKYMDSVVVSEVLETVPFTDEEVDIPWQFKRSGDGSDVFAVAVPKKAVDEHVETLKSLDVHPNAAYSRSTGLAFAVGIANAVVVHLTRGQAAVILVLEGTARTVNRVELDPAHLDDELQAEIVNQAIEQVEVYYQPDARSSEPALLPVLITGPLVDDNSLADAIAKGLPNEIMPFAPAITYPEHFVPHEYAVNIGLALGDLARSKPKKKLAPLRQPTVNLLSARHLPKPWPVWPAATFVTMLMLGAMAVNFTSQVNGLELQAGTLETRLENLQRQERRMKLDQGQATALEQRIVSTQEQQDGLLDQLALLELDKNYLLQRAHWMTAAALTPGVRVDNVAQQGNGFGVTGVAFSYEDVLEYSANLRQSALFSSVQVVRVTGGGTKQEMSVGYSLKVTVLPDFGVEEETRPEDGENTDGTAESSPSS